MHKLLTMFYLANKTGNTMSKLLSTIRVSAILLAMFMSFSVFHSSPANALISIICMGDPETGVITCITRDDSDGDDPCAYYDPGCAGPTFGNPGGSGGGGGGGGGGISPAEQQRQATCAAANKDWADKDCANRRIGNPPSDNQDINFNFPAPGVGGADFMSGSVFEFQRALYNDVTDGT